MFFLLLEVRRPPPLEDAAGGSTAAAAVGTALPPSAAAAAPSAGARFPRALRSSSRFTLMSKSMDPKKALSCEDRWADVESME